MASRITPPLIALDGLLIEGESPRLELATRYAEAVLKAGGLPVALPPIGGPRDIARVLVRVDGLLLTGGDDFDTARLGLGPTHPRAVPVPVRKQDWDFVLARRALEIGLPVLGICYGMQLLGLAEGARLHQHLPEDRPAAREHRGGVQHDVKIEAGTRLAALLGTQRLPVVSRHHQALSSVAPPWRVSAMDDEGLIEGVERDGHPFAVGVQWHPELSYEGSPNDALFRALVSAAGLCAAARERTSRGVGASS